MLKPLNRFLGPAAITAALGGVAYLAIHFAGAQEKTSSGADLLESHVTGRTHLSLCVDGAAGLSVADSGVATVRQALEDALATVTNVPAQYTQREVSTGCPPPRRLISKPMDFYDRHDTDYPDFHTVIGEPGGPVAASEHRVWVYLMSPDTYASSFGTEPYATTTEEFSCGGDVCFGVTSGLYLPTSINPEAMHEGLLRVLGLGPPSTPSNPTVDFSACDRGERPHPYYTCEDIEEWEQDIIKEQQKTQTAKEQQQTPTAP